MTSVIIPVYTLTSELVAMTDECLTSFFNTTPKDVELLVVDDGSPIAYEPDLGKLIKRTSNGGYAAAVNAGLEAAQGDILVLGNNDLIFHENWLTELLFPLNIGYDVATCWTSDQHNIKLSDDIIEDSKFGSIFAMTRAVYETVGGFDEQFRGYFSDTDYRQRIIDEGFRIGKNLSVVVHHEAKATYSVSDPTDKEFLRSQRLFEAKWGFVE